MADARETTRWAVFVIVRNEKNEILLQQRGPDRYLGGFWDFPSGHGEWNEDVRLTAVRELQEEVCLTGRPEDLRLEHIDHYFVEVNYLNFVFSLDSWSGVPKVGEPEKCSGIGWFAEDELPEKCVNVLRAVEAVGFTDELTYSVTDKNVYYNLMGFPQQSVD